MMTVVIRGRRKRRGSKIDWPSPRTWCIGAERYYCRMWTPEYEAGSAKPGRGGRRNRKADRAKIRARIGRRVERKGWPLSWALRKWAIVKGPARPWTDAEVAALVQGLWFVLPAECELQILEPRILGRRERRRRAKLRRRRTRRVRAMARTLDAIGFSEASPLRRLLASGVDPTAKRYGICRTPGA